MKSYSIFIVLIFVAIMIVSVSFALWSKVLYIEGTVNTGYLDGKWISAFNYDQGLDPNPDGSFKDKDVGSTVISGIGTDTLVITINNAYPSYFNDVEVEYQYTGTIPAVVKAINIIPHGFNLASACGANDGPIWVEVVNGVGAQLHQGDTQASSFKIHVEQCAEQGATYTFTVEIVLVQWNEA